MGQLASNCTVCGKEFIKNSPTHKYCGKECRSSVFAIKQRKKYKKKPLKVIRCKACNKVIKTSLAKKELCNEYCRLLHRAKEKGLTDTIREFEYEFEENRRIETYLLYEFTIDMMIDLIKPKNVKKLTKKIYDMADKMHVWVNEAPPVYNDTRTKFAEVKAYNDKLKKERGWVDEERSITDDYSMVNCGFLRGVINGSKFFK